MDSVLHQRWLAPVVAGLAALIAALGWWWVSNSPPKPGPVPTPTPTPLAVDTGWHMAMDANGHMYRIDKRYDGMTDAEKTDANKFGLAYPAGLG